jgi:hypothetical protein
MVKALLTFCEAFNVLVDRYNNSRNHYNDYLTYVDLSENSQSVTNILWSVQHFGKPYNDSRSRYNDSLECIDLSEDGQSVANVLQSVPRLNESYNDSRIVITIPKNIVFNLDH